MLKNFKNWSITILLVLSIALLSLSLGASPAQAQIKLSGSFLAKDACPALQSIRKGTNPGNVQLVPGQTYDLVAKNKTDASHYLLNIPSASPNQRWVAVNCGQTDTPAFVTAPAPPRFQVLPKIMLMTICWPSVGSPVFAKPTPPRLNAAPKPPMM
jgi:hypothetical protein